MTRVTDIRFEHYHPSFTLGVHETKPRISWKIEDAIDGFQQHGYEVGLSKNINLQGLTVSVKRVISPLSYLVPWPFGELDSRERISIRIKVFDEQGGSSSWSEAAVLETGLLQRSDWHCERIAAPWAPLSSGPDPECLFRKAFTPAKPIVQARLYITAQGVYEAEINGTQIGDHFLAPGWTAYDGRIQYQTHDVTSNLFSESNNCIGVRVAEGWFCGRLGWEGGHRNIWGPHPAFIAQLFITYSDGSSEIITTDASWKAAKGPVRLAELYDGEKHDATLELQDWSLPTGGASKDWEDVLVMPTLPEKTELTAGTSPPVRRTQTLPPQKILRSPSGKIIVDFGQNLVGYVKLKNINGPRGHKIVFKHAEVLEHGEMCIRTLRDCKAIDEYTLKGTQDELYEPRFTFHGFRYAEIENFPGDLEVSSVEAIVCHTDMRSAGSFSCSDALLNKLYQNVCWGMKGNFLSVPTDCPQRDERLGWSGDLAVFAPTAVLIYDCVAMLSNWLVDVEYDQGVLGGVPPMVSPNSTIVDPVWCRRVPCAIWHDVTILAPWALYEETGDVAILARQYNSMLAWMRVLPRNKTGATHLWDNSVFNLGDWLDPAAPPDAPWRSPTDARMIANMYLIRSLELMARISSLLKRVDEKIYFETEALAARFQFHDEYVTPNGRIISDTQAAYALAICFDILPPSQRKRATERLVYLVRKNSFKIGTGFAATPFICEALALTGNVQIAYAMLLEKECPSWLYAVTMGATTVWERWDSMLPDGTVNPGDMTSFNHYAYGAIAKFMYERVAGLQRVEPGWTKARVAPAIGANFTKASASHETPYGTVSCSWERIPSNDSKDSETFKLQVEVPYGATVDVVVPEGTGEKKESVGPGKWSFETMFEPTYEWPILPLPPKS